ncbi:MAG: hypothetical protein ACRDN0_12750 [Trebonia sp.]
MRGWVWRRLLPLTGSILLLGVTMFTTTLGPAIIGRSEWALPYDYWGTLLAASRLAHFNLGGLYTQPTGLVSLPGAVVILLPVAGIINATGMSLAIPGPANLHPAVWLLAGPYQVALSCVALFAADALAERLGASWRRRALLAAASTGALWNVTGRWGHPEDAVAVALLLYAILAMSRSRVPLAGWLAGAAVCVQPLVLLALPVLVVVLPWRRMPWFLVRAALPSAVLLAAAAVANWNTTFAAVTSQPDSLVINHPTVWTSLAPHMSGGNVAAGPARAATIVLACCCALAIRRHWRAAASPVAGDPITAAWSASSSGGPAVTWWPPELLADVLWWAALALALRSFFEPVMVAYYPWPVLAVALIPTSVLSWRRLIAASVLAGGLTAAAQGTSHSVWVWWLPIIAGLIAQLTLARTRPRAVAPDLRLPPGTHPANALHSDLRDSSNGAWRTRPRPACSRSAPARRAHPDPIPIYPTYTPESAAHQSPSHRAHTPPGMSGTDFQDHGPKSVCHHPLRPVIMVGGVAQPTPPERFRLYARKTHAWRRSQRTLLLERGPGRRPCPNTHSGT